MTHLFVLSGEIEQLLNEDGGKGGNEDEVDAEYDSATIQVDATKSVIAGTVGLRGQGLLGRVKSHDSRKYDGVSDLR